MNTEELRQSLKDRFEGTAYGYILPYIQKANYRWLQSFDKISNELNLEKIARIRYSDQSKKPLLDNLIRSFEAEQKAKNEKADEGRNRHLRRFRNSVK